MEVNLHAVLIFLINMGLKFRVEEAVIVFGYTKLEWGWSNLGVKAIVQWSCDDMEQQGATTEGYKRRKELLTGLKEKSNSRKMADTGEGPSTTLRNSVLWRKVNLPHMKA